MISRFIFIVLIIFETGVSYSQENHPRDIRYYSRKAGESYQAKDFSKAADYMEKALELGPERPGTMYNLACFYSLAGQKTKAFFYLEKLADIGVDYGVAGDSDFDNIRDTDEFRNLSAVFEKIHRPVENSQIAFRLDRKDLLTEGIAFDPGFGSFYVSSVHLRKIVKIDKTGKAIDFISSGQDGIWSVLAIKIDSTRKTLWACAAALPQGIDYSGTDAGSSGIFKYDLNTGRLLKKYILSGNPDPHNLNDLVIAEDGNIYITDTGIHAVYSISPLTDKLELLTPPGSIYAPGGIAVSGEGSRLYIAAYRDGIYIVDISSKAISKLGHSEDITLSGIDGLYFYNSSLIAIYNGIVPHRVSRLFLSDNSDMVVKSEILEMNNPNFDEPTLGVIADGSFYYIANSQWGSFNDDGSIFPEEKLKSPVILKTGL